MTTVLTPSRIVIDGPGENYDRHGVAVDVQDAGNLRALAREFVRVVESAHAETQSTQKTWEDAAVRLFVNKLESLCRSEANFSEAYHECLSRRGAK